MTKNLLFLVDMCIRCEQKDQIVSMGLLRGVGLAFASRSSSIPDY